MTQRYEVDIRRNRISNLIEEEPFKYDLDHPKTIATALDLDYEVVKKDIQFLKEKHNQAIQKFNLRGLSISYQKKYERMEELRAKAQEMVEKSEGKNKIEAIHLEMSIMNNIYHLESDGIHPIMGELEEREAAKADELEEDRKSNQDQKT